MYGPCPFSILKLPNESHKDCNVLTPKGLDSKAQGCVLATLGGPAKLNDTPKALHRRRLGCNPLRGIYFDDSRTQGCEYATLGFGT
jgi:hypothetical protein